MASPVTLRRKEQGGSIHWSPLRAFSRSRIPLVLVALTGVAHIAVLTFCRKQIEASNLVQLLAALLVVAACLLRARETSDSYLRLAWFKLSAGFAIYTAAQGYFAWSLIWQRSSPRFPSPADFLWMMFAFPLLLITVTRRSGSGWQWADWLDAAQAGTFFSILYVLVFSHQAEISVSLAYELQSVALILSWLIRFSSTQLGAERRFFRDIGLFLVVYGVMSSIGNRWEEYGLPAHGLVGLCWSLPLLFFSTLVLRAGFEVPRHETDEKSFKVSLPGHLHGLSALGLSVMSIVTAGVLALHHSRAGLGALALAFVIFALRTCIRESQLHLAHGTLEHAVMHDPVTGLASRTRLLSELDRQLATCEGEEAGVALLFIDLDRFKLINDSLGHAFGDRILITVAGTLRSAVRSTDLVVRLAGDEFVVLLSCNELATVRKLAETIVRQLREPISLDGRVLHISASVGYATSRPGIGADQLLRDADCAMYAAKKQGKNQTRSFHDGVADTAKNDLQLESELRNALENDEIVVHFQPICSSRTRDVEGFEALVRWEHPCRGLIPPVEFISLAEQTGLIIALGKQVLSEACRHVQQWNEAYGRQFTVSVNVSARQFADPALLEDIETILLQSGLPAHLLRLEITESVLLNGETGVSTLLTAARSRGIAISLDDFLTGYSSLPYLLQYPCDIVKIDRSFVRSLDTDPRRAELVRTVVQLAENLEMKVIAEGVETEEELTRLNQMGCQLVQGLLFSRPLPADQIEALLESSNSLLIPRRDFVTVSS